MFAWSLVLALAPALPYALPTVPSLGTITLLQARERLGRAAFVTGTPRCVGRSRFCFGLVVHVIEQDDVPVVTPQWFYAQVAAANTLFGEIEVAFEPVEVRSAPGDWGDVASRSDRDRLGRGEHDPGVVHVWLVRRLADVDIEGDEIRGVHWRDRADLARRFVILSSIAGDRTLAHELGHFFGLPHSTYPISIMNKTPRDDPPWELRGFHPREIARMRGRRDAMVGDGTLLLRKPARARRRR
jgi:hypothetical protein